MNAMNKEDATLKTLFIPTQDYVAEVEDETNRWFDRDHVPERLSCEGFIGCERFQLTDIQSLGWTSRLRCERYEIASESIAPMPGELTSDDQPRYMDVCDIETPEIVTNPVFWNMHSAPSERATALAPHATVRGIGVYLQRPSP